MNKVLLVEDDPAIGEHLLTALRAHALDVHWERTVEGLEDQLSGGERYDLVVLDRLVGPADTKTFLRRLKGAWPAASVFVVSAISTPNERTELIDLGADDYIGKPFSTQEMVARAKSLLRRSGAGLSRYIRLGDTLVDRINRSVSREGVSERLPAKEFLLLEVLAQESGRVWSRESLLSSVWGSNSDLETNVVEATVANLRRKLAQLGGDVKIRNMRNSGYWIEA